MRGQMGRWPAAALDRIHLGHRVSTLPPAAEPLHDALVETGVDARHRYRQLTPARMIELQGKHLIEGVPQIPLRRIAGQHDVRDRLRRVDGVTRRRGPSTW